MVGKSLQEHHDNAWFLKAPLLVLYFSYTHYVVPDDIFCITIYADGTTLYSKSGQASDLGQQL